MQIVLIKSATGTQLAEVYSNYRCSFAWLTNKQETIALSAPQEKYMVPFSTRNYKRLNIIITIKY